MTLKSLYLDMFQTFFRYFLSILFRILRNIFWVFFQIFCKVVEARMSSWMSKQEVNQVNPHVDHSLGTAKRDRGKARKFDRPCHSPNCHRVTVRQQRHVTVSVDHHTYAFLHLTVTQRRAQWPRHLNIPTMSTSLSMRGLLPIAYV